jgi:hypothetical protein
MNTILMNLLTKEGFFMAENNNVPKIITVDLAKKLLTDKSVYLTEEGRRLLLEIVKDEDKYRNQIIN